MQRADWLFYLRTCENKRKIDPIFLVFYSTYIILRVFSMFSFSIIRRDFRRVSSVSANKSVDQKCFGHAPSVTSSKKSPSSAPPKFIYKLLRMYVYNSVYLRSIVRVHERGVFWIIRIVFITIYVFNIFHRILCLHDSVVLNIFMI